MAFVPTQPPTYDPVAVKSMREELIATGCEEFLVPDDVDQALDRRDNATQLVVLNSVCGCSAGTARPGVMLALQSKIIPDELYTVFAGMEKDAVDQYRQKYMANHMPSSPSIGLFKNGEPITVLHRSDIEGNSAEQIASILVEAFERLCSRKGPSVSIEEFERITQGKYGCSSNLPKFRE
ncbi:MAG: putative YphP/YqiW family bacilliredoxin [Flavobacteriales bacterium]|jgi:putative YphP/YqiW family bacilliredoxin